MVVFSVVLFSHNGNSFVTYAQYVHSRCKGCKIYCAGASFKNEFSLHTVNFYVARFRQIHHAFCWVWIRGNCCFFCNIETNAAFFACELRNSSGLVAECIATPTAFGFFSCFGAGWLGGCFPVGKRVRAARH